MNHTFDTFIQRGDDELEVRVTYSVTPFVAATYWQPAEGGEVELITAEFRNVDRASLPATLTDAEEAALITECEERCHQDMADEVADRADYLRDHQQDRWMMEKFA